MKKRFLMIGTLLLTACAPTSQNHMGNDSTGLTTGGGMMGGNRDGMMQGSFLPAHGKDINQLPEAKPTSILEIREGDTITLNPELVKGTLNGKSFAMYAYNGQFPGPILKVKQGSTFTVNVTNNIDQPTTIHWHGIRLENKFDGAAGVTQDPIKPGESFAYTVRVPDEGMFWYHPHVREDLQQDMGLYGNLWVTPKDEKSYGTVSSEAIIILDDILLKGGVPVSYGAREADHALMGRFGNTMFVNGETNFNLAVSRGATIRFYLTNAANTRTFNIRFPSTSSGQTSAKMKIIGGDAGRKEHEEFADAVILSPSERSIVEVRFAQQGTYRIESVGTEKTWLLGTVSVSSQEIGRDRLFDSLQTHEDVVTDIEAYRSYFEKPMDKIIHLFVESTMGGMMHGDMNASDGDVSEWPAMSGVEWEDLMPHQNAMSTKHNTKWKLIDEKSAEENMDIDYDFKAGDKVKIRIINDSEEDGSDHPMQHPIHFHGQRFLVLAVNGERNKNLVWKDTVLVPKDATVDILLDAVNPGDWMAHCHIAEHLSNGMMATFTVQ